MMKRAAKYSALIFFSTIAPACPVFAESSADSGQQLLDELRLLVEKSREQRAADRWLQRDLEDLVARYDWPWRQSLLSETFADGDFSSNPRWQVVSGEFRIEPRLGLRSYVPAQAVASESSRQAPSDAELGGMIVGALLDRALGSPGDGAGNASARPRPGEPARIRLPLAIPAVFALDATFSLGRQETTRFDLALLQDDAGQGYLLRLESGSGGFVELQRIRNGGVSVVHSAVLTADPADGRDHRLSWRQAANGTVTVELDERTLFSVLDRSWSGAYRALELTNHGGDVAVSSFSIFGP